MRSMKSMMMGGAILLGLAMCLTSCEGTLDDVFGEWSRPTGNNSKQGDSSTTNATAITLDQTMKVLVKGGDALTITATVTPSDATFTWESSDKAVATVENGVVTPVGAGIATITAKSGDVTATCEVFVGNEVDLGTKIADYTVQNYDILKGTLNSSYAISIPNDIKVVFNGMKTTKQIACDGNATIYLADGSENEVTAPYSSYKAGIQIGGTGTLTINAETVGDGQLTAKGGYMAAGIGTNQDETGGNIVINGGTVTATGGGSAAGIGTGRNGSGTLSCGNIVINGGTVTATGGDHAAGIGTGRANAASITCGDITINGGTVTATGGMNAAGIGTGISASTGASNTCGAIMIGTGVTMVTATKGTGSPNSIGTGKEDSGTQTCGTITIGGTIYWDGSAYQNGGDTYLVNNITYTPSN